MLASLSGRDGDAEAQMSLSEEPPMHRFTSTESMGEKVFPCSEAAGTIPGAALSMEGGWTWQ